MTTPDGRVLFLVRNLYYLRNFEAPIRALAERGHDVTVLADPAKHLPDEIRSFIGELVADLGGRLSIGEAFGRQDFRQRLADDIHTGRDILRFYTEPFRNADPLRRRAAAKATPVARALYHRPRNWNGERNRRADDRLRRWDESLPLDKAIVSRLEAIAPAVLVVSPLVDLRTDQIDWVRAARALRIPTVLGVASWDNLTSKSRIQVPVDRVIVWNEIQRAEAIDLHGIEPGRIAVTGAQLYDDWFVRKPSIDRRGFCAAYGFDPERPVLLYVGSSTAIAGNEAGFVARWLDALRNQPDPAVAGANVLIRAHPMNPAGYDRIDVGAHPPAALMEPLMPVVEATKAAYFDALHHADLVVGLNTSALVEASIFGKGSYTMSDPGHAAGQQETLHYHYLTAARLLHEAPDLAAHFAMLSTALLDGGPDEAAADFVAEFIRPHGRDRPATPAFADAVESAIDLPVHPDRPKSRPLRGVAIDLLAAVDQAVLATARWLRRTGGRPPQSALDAPRGREPQDAR